MTFSLGSLIARAATRLAGWRRRVSSRLRPGVDPGPADSASRRLSEATANGRAESGPPAHWVALVREHAPTLLEPEDDNVADDWHLRDASGFTHLDAAVPTQTGSACHADTTAARSIDAERQGGRESLPEAIRTPRRYPARRDEGEVTPPPRTGSFLSRLFHTPTSRPRARPGQHEVGAGDSSRANGEATAPPRADQSERRLQRTEKPLNDAPSARDGERWPASTTQPYRKALPRTTRPDANASLLQPARPRSAAAAERWPCETARSDRAANGASDPGLRDRQQQAQPREIVAANSASTECDTAPPPQHPARRRGRAKPVRGRWISLAPNDLEWRGAEFDVAERAADKWPALLPSPSQSPSTQERYSQGVVRTAHQGVLSEQHLEPVPGHERWNG